MIVIVNELQGTHVTKIPFSGASRFISHVTGAKWWNKELAILSARSNMCFHNPNTHNIFSTILNNVDK